MVRRVILVGIDGLRPEAIEHLSLTNLGRLVERGASALNAQSVTPGFFAAGLASLMTGVSPSRHGVVTNDGSFSPALSRLEPLGRCIATDGFQVSGFLPELPLHRRGPAGFIARELGFRHLSFKGLNASDVISSALNALCTQRRGLIAIQFPDVGCAGTHEWMSPEYRQAAQRVDQSIGILNSLSGASSGDSLLIVLTDHDEGAEFRAIGAPGGDRRMSVILSGRCVSNRSLDGVSLLDVPSTILWALGIALPRHYEGRPLTEAFEFASAPVRAFA